MSSAVVSIKPFHTPDITRFDSVNAMSVAVRLLLRGDNSVIDAPGYVESPVEAPVKPHWFKRLYKEVLDRASLSCRVTQEQLAGLLSIDGWQDKVRRIVYGLVRLWKRIESAPLESDYDHYASEYGFDESMLEADERFIDHSEIQSLYKQVNNALDSSAIFTNVKSNAKAKYKELADNQIDRINICWDRNDLELLIEQYTEARSEELAEGKGATFGSVYASAWIKAIKNVLKDWN